MARFATDGLLSGRRRMTHYQACRRGPPAFAWSAMYDVHYSFRHHKREGRLCGANFALLRSRRQIETRERLRLAVLGSSRRGGYDFHVAGQACTLAEGGFKLLNFLRHAGIGIIFNDLNCNF